MTRKQSTRFIPIIAVLLALLILVVGCTKPEPASNDKTAPAQKPKEITVSWMRDLGPSNPHAYYPNQLFSQSMLYEPLVSYNEGGELKPYLAESWNISTDGKEYTFKLRKNIKFSDGSSFNAAIVKRNFDAIMKNKSTHSWLGIAKVLEKTEIVDEHTIKLTLSEPYYPALQDLATVRPFRFLGEAGFPEGDDTLKDLKAPIGTGPWMITEYKQDQYTVFTRNPNYWGEQPTVDKVTVKIIPDSETRVLAFEKGELDMLFGEGAISLDAYKQLQGTGKYGTALSDPVGTRNILLNSSNEMLADQRVRLALQHGINKQSIVDGILGGVEQKADSLLSNNYPYVDLKVNPIDYSTAKATAYLDEAGWKLAPGQTIREKDGKKLELELVYDKTDPIQKVLGEAVQAAWGEIGVKLNIAGMELTAATKLLREGKFDVRFWFNSGVPYDPHTLINAVKEPSFGVAEAHSRIPMKQELDKKIQTVLASTNEVERKKLYTEILTTLHEQSVIVPISYIKQTVVYNKSLSNVTFPASRWDHPFNGIK
ncbi:nickel ABC transporter, nickel/metallophore periplasmic binding protein [Paenibacillus pectinilyticus]|uniref:Nickel ABC transporter, nickel/metallophore periplasmic binding protein n=1 Tax=Paenibacillus pectinilyticus TaxID=512399 RepID=A0A1C1A8E3_9BACL|nr:nickel ABC transporter substrate-binding protein [Paenibacillus pectinilyticus]OCT16887.1 nickel ABC transporter, nickel/metallophore periplasmic binding protein [Paenibacillus pectinilyticus]